jgi:hypothetical protein
MKIPKKIDILGSIYEIVISDDLQEDLKDIAPVMRKGKDYIGFFSSEHQKIWIDADSSQAQKEKTLLHEIIEVINTDLALNLVHDNIDRLEHGLYYTLTRNKLLKE